MTTQELTRLIELQEESNEIQRQIAARRSVIEMNGKIVGKEVAPFVETSIVDKTLRKNRGLATR